MASEAGGGECESGGGAGGKTTFRWREPDDVEPRETASHRQAQAVMGSGGMASDPTDSKTPLMRRLRRRRCTIAAVVILGVLILLVLLSFLAFGKESARDDDLLMVSVIFRHGDRTPTETYPNDPYQESSWPEGMGALTNRGKMQMFQLGEWLRRRYSRLLGRLYDPRALLVQSSANVRCLMSAEALLAGLMPPAPEQRWNPDLPWQPIPVHYVARDKDMKIAAKKQCSRYDVELKDAYNSPEIQGINSANEELFEYLTNHTGKVMKTITDVEFLYTTLLIEKIHGRELPPWTVPVFPEKMRELAARSLAIFTFSDFMKRIRGGPLLKEISINMAKEGSEANASRSSSVGGRMFLYSAHDLTIVNVWRALGFSELLLVDYGAALIFELRRMQPQQREDRKLQVKVLYQNSSSTAAPTALRVPGCEEPCELNAFLEAVGSMLPGDDWEKECAVGRR